MTNIFEEQKMITLKWHYERPFLKKIMTNRCFLRCPVWDQSTHHFPNHKKHPDRFKAWVEAIDRKLETDEDYEYFRTKRLCHIHFIPMYCYNYRRLSPFAVPTLYLTKESRDEYWSKDLELRKLMQHSKSPHYEISNDNTQKDGVETKKDEAETQKDAVEPTKDEAEAQKDVAETYHEKPVMGVPVEKIFSNNIQSLLQSDLQESLVKSLIADILEGENENNADVQEQPVIELSVPSPVESYVPKPVADIIIEYVSTTDEGSVQKLSMKQIPRDITISEEVESLPLEPVFIHDVSVDSTALEISAEEVERNFDSVQNCSQQPKKKRKSKYEGLSWELPLRIPMEHNYSKASIVAPTSHISSNGVHPKKTIITLKRQVKELREKLKFYKQKCKNLLLMNQEGVTKQIKSKKITRILQKGQACQKKAFKNVITYSNLKKAGCSISLPRNI